MRKDPIVPNEVYHVMSKSIAGFGIFHSQSDYERMFNLLEYFSVHTALPKFSYFLDRAKVAGKNFHSYFDQCFENSEKDIDWIAFCLMPTHIHLVLRERVEGAVSRLMSHALNGYTRYFNTKYERRGPLWEGRFKNVLVETDEQLLHLTRYVHLNPVTAKLIEDPGDWPYSSYHQYLGHKHFIRPKCEYGELLQMSPTQYDFFVNDQKELQRELAEIKRLALETT